MSVQLPAVLVRNSFNIIGLSSSSTVKEVRKRSQQLLQLAKIAEAQEFETDIGHVREFRNEGDIRRALERLSSIQDRLQEIFFWFDDHSVESRKAVTLVSKGDYHGALATLDKADNVSADWLGYKNLALTLILDAFAATSIDSFDRSLKCWKRIAESDEFWRFYERQYLLHDELGTSSSLFHEFRDRICDFLSVIAVALYHQTKNPAAIGACYSSFGRIGKIIDIEVLQPVISKIKREIADLEEIDPESELDPDCVGRALEKIHNSFSDLAEFELWEYSPVTILKDDTAEKLRSISVDLYNQNDDIAIARLFLEQSANLAVSDAVADRIKADMRQLQVNEVWEFVSDRFEHVKTLIEDQNIEEAKGAYLRLDKELAARLDESSAAIRIRLLMDYCALLMVKGHELFEKKILGIAKPAIAGLLNWQTRNDAIRAFEQAVGMLTGQMHLFVFVDPVADKASLSERMKAIFKQLNSCELGSLFDSHQSYLHTVEEIAQEQEDENTRRAIGLLGTAVCGGVLYRRCQSSSMREMWKSMGRGAVLLFGWGALILFGLCLLLLNDKPAANRTNMSSVHAKSSYSTSSPSLTYEERRVIEHLEKNEPEGLKKVRKQGYSDKEIARYVIEHYDDEEE